MSIISFSEASTLNIRDGIAYKTQILKSVSPLDSKLINA